MNFWRQQCFPTHSFCHLPVRSYIYIANLICSYKYFLFTWILGDCSCFLFSLCGIVMIDLRICGYQFRSLLLTKGKKTLGTCSSRILDILLVL